jgi:hypothetical protein
MTLYSKEKVFRNIKAMSMIPEVYHNSISNKLTPIQSKAVIPRYD